MAIFKNKKELITAAVEESFDAFAYLIDQADGDLDKLNAEFVKHGFRVEVNVCDVVQKITSKDMEFITSDAVNRADIGELIKETSADLIKSMTTPIGLIR